MADGNTYPRIPESNWWAIRAQFRRSIPPAVTRSYLKSLLSLTSDKAASNLLAPLRQMKLIDETGKPTDRANAWRDDDQYATVCGQIAEEIYPPELRSLYPGPDFDKDKISSWFMTTAKLGEGAAKVVASMYILLNNKEIKTETSNGNVGAEKSNKKNPPKKPEVKLKSTSTEKNNGGLHVPSAMPPSGLSSPPPNLHIDLQIHISPDASSEQIENIFASIAKHLYKK